jgi:hypothetical protein
MATSKTASKTRRPDRTTPTNDLPQVSGQAAVENMAREDQTKLREAATNVITKAGKGLLNPQPMMAPSTNLTAELNNIDFKENDRRTTAGGCRCTGGFLAGNGQLY